MRGSDSDWIFIQFTLSGTPEYGDGVTLLNIAINPLAHLNDFESQPGIGDGLGFNPPMWLSGLANVMTMAIPSKKTVNSYLGENGIFIHRVIRLSELAYFPFTSARSFFRA